MFEKMKPGQTLKCTVVKEPRRQDARQTVTRLMQQDPDVRRKLKKAQEHRMRNLVVRSRGKRPWEVRRKASRHAIPRQGATWTMTYVPHVRPDFESVADFVKVETA